MRHLALSSNFLLSIAGVTIVSLSAASEAKAIGFLSTSNGQVGQIDPVTGVFSALPDSTPGFTDIALSGNGDLFGVDFTEFFRIDPSAGTSSRIGNAGFFLNALGFSTDNVLYGAGGSGFYTVNLSTGVASLLANIPGFNSSGDLVFDALNNRFLATSGFGGLSTLFSITPSGAGTPIGSVGFSDVFGLFFEGGTLYGYTANRQQIIINPATGVGTFNRNVVGVEGQIFGAAGSPDAAAVPEPASILGFLGAGAIGAALKRKMRG